MRSHTLGIRSCLFALAFGALVCAANTTLAQTQDSALNSGDDILLKRQQTEAHLRQGRLLFKQQRIEEALAEYTKAFDLMRTYDIALELGKAEARLGWHTLAATHLRYAILHLPLSAMPKERDALNREFESLRAKVGGLSLRVSQAGAEIFVDGKVLGVSPLADDVFVMPGEHVVEAKLAGFEASTKRVNVSAGGTEVVEMNLAAVQAPKGTGDPKGEAPKVVEVKRSRVPIFVGAGLGAVALGFGIGFTVAANDKSDEGHALREELLAAGTRCTNPPSTDPCKNLKGIANAHDLVYDLAAISFVVGGVAALATATYGLWPQSKKTAKTQGVQLSPAAGKAGGGVWLHGSF